jgi:hypothetical protein
MARDTDQAYVPTTILLQQLLMFRQGAENDFLRIKSASVLECRVAISMVYLHSKSTNFGIFFSPWTEIVWNIL